jgi:hypothetical protein
MLLRPDIRTPRCLCRVVAIVSRLADRGIFMLLLPSQATQKRIHPKNTWAGVGVDFMLGLVLVIFPRRLHTR